MRKILVAIANPETAKEHAEEIGILAKDLNAKIIGLYLIPTLMSAPPEEFHPVGEAIFKDLSDGAEKHNVSFEGKIDQTSDMAKYITETADRKDVNLIVMGVGPSKEAKTGETDVVVTPFGLTKEAVTDRVIHLSKRPVLILPTKVIKTLQEE